LVTLTVMAMEGQTAASSRMAMHALTMSRPAPLNDSGTIIPSRPSSPSLSMIPWGNSPFGS